MKKQLIKEEKKEEFRLSWFYLKKIANYFKPYTFRIIVSIVSMGIVAAASAYTAYLVKPALDRIFIEHDREALKTIPFLLVMVFAVKGFFHTMQVYQMQYCALRVLETLRNNLYNKMLRLPLGYFEHSRVGMLISRIINDVEMMRNGIPHVIMFARYALTMVGLIFVAFYQQPYLAAWSMLILPMGYSLVFIFGRKMRKVGRRNQAKIADISSIIQEIFSGIRVVKAFAMEKGERDKFNAQNNKLVHIALRGAFYRALSSPLMEFLGAIGAGIIIWYGGKEVIAGKMTPGTFFSFLTALAMLYDPIKRISKSNMNIQRALAGAERVFEILDSREIKEEDQGEVRIEPYFKNLEFHNVSFTYSGSFELALKEISLQVRPKERLAIVGPSGAGKTSLVNLIPRFYHPLSGEIILNNRKLTEYTLESLRRFIGMVSQDTVLFNTTIRENVTYGLGEVPDETLHEVCRIAYTHDFIQALPNGYDTIIGERGIKLSGGEKQRLTIARALLKDPPLLILDEATSALDTESERIVQRALENLMYQRTSIVIAHRLSTVLSADRIMVLDQGSILDIAPHEQLLQRCSLYQKLYQMQFEDHIR